MAMSKGVGVGSITIGCSLFVLAIISMICGGVVMSNMSRPASVSIGLWGIYFAIPGVLSILAGYKRHSSLLAVALGMHVLGIILAIVGVSLGAALWAVLASNCGPHIKIIYSSSFIGRENLGDNYCYCYFNNKILEYPASCSNLDTVREATGAVTIIFALFAILTIVGSIYGCVGTCCAPREPTVIVTTAQQPNTMVMTTQQGYVGYSQQPPPYGEPAQDQVVFDSKP